MFGSAQKHAFLSQTCCLYWAFLAHLSVKSSWVKTALRWHYFLEIPPNKQWNVPRMNFENLPKFTLTFLGSFLTHFCWRLLEDLPLEISSISIDVKILSVSSLISFQSLKFVELTLRLKCRFWKMSWVNSREDCVPVKWFSATSWSCFFTSHQSKRRSQGLSLDAIYHCLNRTILYQFSRAHKTVPQQVALLDSLRVLTVNRNLILGPGNHDQEFISCLAHCLINLHVGR